MPSWSPAGSIKISASFEKPGGWAAKLVRLTEAPDFEEVLVPISRSTVFV